MLIDFFCLMPLLSLFHKASKYDVKLSWLMPSNFIEVVVIFLGVSSRPVENPTENDRWLEYRAKHWYL